MNVSRQQYLEALDIVERYHRQDIQPVKVHTTDMSWGPLEDVEVGTVVECVRTYSAVENSLTIGKTYEVIDMVNYDNRWFSKYFFIIDDKGRKKKYNTINRFRTFKVHEK